ncbi:phage tail assembly protein [Gluconobacter oxydans]|uniref:phage tail assembly protein n=1 Tax=Gluconobacter oxydans TaxID=442 RepID=UPI00264A2903|nr:phage tail assembly protein [Gluconobacter oxydans]WKE49034.1 phage tail assembly protein [Gluconobacter oxydans]
MNTNREIPDYIKVAEDGSTVTVTLSRPVELDGVKRDTITLREPTAGEQKRFQVAPNAPAKVVADNEGKLFAALADGLTPENLDALPLRDYGRVQVGYSFFLD